MEILKKRIYNSSLELAENAAAELHSKISILELQKEKVNIALSGGNTPGLLFSALAEKYSEKINWKKVNLFWVDERCVPPIDAESNYGMTKEKLLKYIKIPEENVYRIKGEINPAEEAERYSIEIISKVDKKNNLPSFDIVLLGIGEDGHTASIFPDKMNLFNSEKICEVTVHPNTGQKRITLTGPVINNAAQVIFLISGRSKSEVVSKIINKENGADRFPAFYIKPATGRLEWWLDKDAAQILIF